MRHATWLEVVWSTPLAMMATPTDEALAEEVQAYLEREKGDPDLDVEVKVLAGPFDIVDEPYVTPPTTSYRINESPGGAALIAMVIALLVIACIAVYVNAGGPR